MTLQLPTAAQIAAITDVPSLRLMLDDAERGVIQIETQLEFDTGDEEWARRAANALAAFRFAERVLKRRLHTLTRPSGQCATRPTADCHPLTLASLAERPDIDSAALSSVAEVDGRLAWLVERINAVRDDRDDEVAQPAGERDEGFLAAVNTLNRHMSGLRQQLQIRRGELTKAAKAAAARQRDLTRQQLFIDAARDLLPPTTYRALWDRVERVEAETSIGQGKAA